MFPLHRQLFQTSFHNMATERVVLKRANSTIDPPSAGILIIGDEILKGHTQDTNSHFLLMRLWSLGVKVRAVSVVPDDIEQIASHVSDFSSRFTYVLTSGGIGPTHDDVTMQAIAKAFNEPLVQNQYLTDVLVKLYNVEDASQLNKFVLKMAQIPSTSKVKRDIENETHTFPLISLRNVYIFPGVPEYLQSLFDQFSHVFSNAENMFHLQKFYLSVEESMVAEELQKVHDRYGNKVHLGSYPEVGCAEFKTKLTLESLKPEALQKASDYLTTLLPCDAVIRIETLSSGSSSINDATQTVPETNSSSVEIYSVLSSAEITNVCACVRGAWAVLQETLTRYNLDELCISFNGGKDCTVLLALYHAAVMKKYPSFDGKLNALYVQGESPFVEAEEFILKCSKMYNLNVIRIKSNIKEALGSLQTTHPCISGILMGTRRNDPHSEKLKLFSLTDSGWPKYWRINPILNWQYSDVWSVLMKCKIPYLSLYDEGYTSIGCTQNTKRNPALRKTDGVYKPAYMLEDESREREGRI